MSRLALLQEQVAHHDRLVEGFTGALSLAQAHHAAGGPSVAWLLGHVTWEVDTVLPAVAALPPTLDAGWNRHLVPHWGVADEAGWRALRARWRATAAARRDALAGLRDGDLDLAPAVPMHPQVHGGRSTRLRFLQGHVFHVAYHLGQMGRLRAAQGLDWHALARD
jgi:hypothetical protein